MRVAQKVWSRAEVSSVRESKGQWSDPERMKASLVAARASQRNEKCGLATIDEAYAEVKSYASCCLKDIDKWLRNVRTRKIGERRVLNKEQYEVVKLVATRVKDEMRALSKKKFVDIGEPLRWCVHGGPGTGKSHVIKLWKEELFQGVLKWNMGVEFQIVAFQAVMADLLGEIRYTTH